MAPESHRREDYLFELPQDRIAQKPADKRDQSKLLVSGKTGTIQHGVFSDLPDYLQPGDVLVLNQTRVMNARLFAQNQMVLKSRYSFSRFSVTLRMSRCFSGLPNG